MWSYVSPEPTEHEGPTWAEAFDLNDSDPDSVSDAGWQTESGLKETC